MDARMTYRGRLEREDVLEVMKGARALVFPSTWYENFPVTIAEAFASGLPVLGSRIGAIEELIEHGRTGLLFRAGDPNDLAATLQRAWSRPVATRRMGEAARHEYETRYTGAASYTALVEAYELARSRFDGGSESDMNAATGRFHQQKELDRTRERNPANREPRTGISTH
jgi:glycosyltransferase involved in cell wall biosynthesis